MLEYGNGDEPLPRAEVEVLADGCDDDDGNGCPGSAFERQVCPDGNYHVRIITLSGVKNLN